jgi:hypothetical protein
MLGQPSERGTSFTRPPRHLWAQACSIFLNFRLNSKEELKEKDEGCIGQQACSSSEAFIPLQRGWESRGCAAPWIVGKEICENAFASKL